MDIKLHDHTMAQLRWHAGACTITYRATGHQLTLPVHTTPTPALIQRMYAALRGRR